MTESYADRVLREALTAATGGLDPRKAEAALEAAVEAISKQMQALAAKDYADLAAEQIARAATHTTKASDVLFRLMEFARGHADSRPDMGREWLRALTNEQLAQVVEWVEAAKASEGKA